MGKKQTHNQTSQTRAKRSAHSQQVTTRQQLTDAHILLRAFIQHIALLWWTCMLSAKIK